MVCVVYQRLKRIKLTAKYSNMQRRGLIAGSATWTSKVQRYLVAGNLKLAKNKAEMRDGRLAANITVGIG